MNVTHTRRLQRALVLLVCGVALGRAPAAADAPKRPSRFEIQGVPFVKQRGDWCGPAALASVLQYHGEKITQEQIASEIYLPRRGTLNLDLLLFARRRGFPAAAQSGTADLLKETVAAGIPLICQVEREGRHARRTHFVVVYGYDDAQKTYRLHQGTEGSVAVSQEAFEKAWKPDDHWMLIVRPKPKAEASDAAK